MSVLSIKIKGRNYFSAFNNNWHANFCNVGMEECQKKWLLTAIIAKTMLVLQN